MKTIVKEKCTSVHGTPTMFADMLVEARETGVDLSSLQTGIIAGGPCQSELMRQVSHKLEHKYNLDMFAAYGKTKASSVVFQAFYRNVKEKMSAVRYPEDHVEVAIFSEEGEVVPVGVRGEQVTRGVGYAVGGWFHTGNEAVMDSKGHVHILGRIEEGENGLTGKLKLKREVQNDGIVEKVAAWVKINPGHSLTSILIGRKKTDGIKF